MSLKSLTHKGQPVTAEGIQIFLAEDGRLRFTAHGRIDTDGLGPSHGDKWHLNDTSLKQDGKSLNADYDHYIVLPPQVINAVAPIVLGCQARVKNTRNGKVSAAVVGDIGPHARLGEISYALAIALGINPDPNEGGEDEAVIEYDIWPGSPAHVGNKIYTLQPS